ncbi:hypothetical protein [uncultured Prevotella sp.]|nr:hypothetical protein [uncultured Prevotella sp.]
MKSKKENYVAPLCNTVEMEPQQIICASGDEIPEATHESFDEEEYDW